MKMTWCPEHQWLARIGDNGMPICVKPHVSLDTVERRAISLLKEMRNRPGDLFEREQDYNRDLNERVDEFLKLVNNAD